MYDLNRYKEEVPQKIWDELKGLPCEDQDKWLTNYESSRKGYGLSLFLWLFGFHYIYYQKFQTQLIFWVTFGGFGLWWIFDLIRMPILLNNWNMDEAEKVFNTVKRADPSLNGAPN